MRVAFKSVASSIALVALLLGSTAAFAQTGNVMVGASGIDGIQMETWAAGEIPAIESGQGLRLSRLHFDPCTGIVFHNNGGSALIYAESTGVQYVFQGGESYPDTPLEQGDSVIADPSAYLTIINPNSDPAFSVDLLVLSVTEGDSYVDVPMIESETFEFPNESGCDGINPDGLVTPEILGEGVASETGDTLYIGSVVFGVDSTTEGWALINEGSSFNVVVLVGGMSTAGPNSGRAAWIGPGGVIHDYFNDGQIPSFPFVNSGSTPVLGLVFGTVAGDGSVWLPE